MSNYKIAVIIGSNRRESLNRKLAEALVELGEANFASTIVQIDDLPLYNQDLEAELPASVVRFKSQIAEADGVLFVTPEHSRSIPAVLKSALDWGSRPYGQNSWAGKPAAITGTSPGAIATAVAQQHLRQILGVLGALVMGGEAYITFKSGLLTDTGKIGDESTKAFLQAFMDQFASLVEQLSFRQSQRSAAA
jgi:chromate reductase